MRKASSRQQVLTDQDRFADLTLLKQSDTKFPESPAKAKLEVFKNIYQDQDFEVTFECPEFTSLCPVTGQPDFGSITIVYQPKKHCIESKSLKLYLFSFRNYHAFHEETVNTVLEAVTSACKPQWAEVTGVFRPRGGVSIQVKARSGKKKIAS